MSYQEPIFVQSARISAHLFFATEVAKNISLASKNARAITVRAGPKAAGFIAITGFIEELSQVTIARSNSINNIAVRVSRISTELERSESVRRDFSWVYQRADNAPHIRSIDAANTKNEKRISDYSKAFKTLIGELEAELEESRKQIRTANMLVSTARIEATQSGEFQSSFKAIAEKLNEAAMNIRKQLSAAESILENARDQLKGASNESQ